MAVDYVDIGQRIKAKRIKKGWTQEKLSEMIGVGPSHMSHIESGSTVPSFDVFLSILNALECSSDELLCREVQTSKPLLNSWLSELVADCDLTETKIISDIVKTTIQTLRKNKPTD
ncbi:MAG: helix-turn-helix transcriptional regulator [Oscillospiraceae bacterium]|nr:helix-turn-helix transcriptional regulator [Oscillospiraceae bacterium]